MIKLKEIDSFNSKNNKVQRLILLSNFIKTKKIILLILENEYFALNKLLNLILKYYHIKKNLKISTSKDSNIKKVKKIIFSEWKIEKKDEEIFNLLLIYNKHKKSTMEILNKNKITILDENNKTTSISLEKLIEFSKIINKLKIKFNEYKGISIKRTGSSLI